MNRQKTTVHMIRLRCAELNGVLMVIAMLFRCFNGALFTLNRRQNKYISMII